MTPNEQRRANIATRRQIRAEMKQRGFTFAEQRLMDRMVEGMPWADAAKASGVPKWRAGHLVMMAEFRAELFRRMTAVRAAEGPRNLALTVKLREDGFKEGATAADKRVALEAVRHLEGTDMRPGTVVNVGVRIGPGLIVDLSDDDASGPVLDLIPSRPTVPIQPTTSLMARFEIEGDEEDPAGTEELAVRPLLPQPTEPGFRGRTIASNGQRPVQTKRYRMKPRG